MEFPARGISPSPSRTGAEINVAGRQLPPPARKKMQKVFIAFTYSSFLQINTCKHLNELVCPKRCAWRRYQLTWNLVSTLRTW